MRVYLNEGSFFIKKMGVGEGGQPVDAFNVGNELKNCIIIGINTSL